MRSATAHKMHFRLALAALHLLLPRVRGWIHLREGGDEITFQTSVQVGDWDYGAVGQDLFITGDMHVGKNASVMHVSGSWTCRGALFAKSVEVEQTVRSPELRSAVRLDVASGAGKNIEFHPGFLGNLSVGSDIYVQGQRTVTSQELSAGNKVILGNLALDFNTSTFNQSSVTFDVAKGGSLVLNQRNGSARMVVQSDDSSAREAVLLLRSSSGTEYQVSSTLRGGFDISFGGTTPLLQTGFVGGLPFFQHTGALQVQRGAAIRGGVQVLDLGMEIKGSASVDGGVTITDRGITVRTGVVNVTGGVAITDGLVVTNSSLVVNDGGVQVVRGGINVSYGGVRVRQGGLNVEAGGLNVTGGMKITSQGAVVQTGSVRITEGGLLVRDVGLVVKQGRLRVAANGTHITGGLRLVDSGLTIDRGGQTIRGSANVTGGVNVVHGGLAVEDGHMRVLAGGLNVSDGLSITNVGMLLDGRSLKYVASTMVRNGTVAINPSNVSNSSHRLEWGAGKTEFGQAWTTDSVNDAGYFMIGEHRAMLDVGASWSADLSIVPATTNTGSVRVQARGGNQSGSFVVKINDAATHFQWARRGGALGPAIALAKDSWIPLTDGVEFLFNAPTSFTTSGGDAWTITVTEVGPFRLLDAGGAQSFYIGPNGTFRTSSNFTVENGVIVSGGLQVRTRGCISFDVRGACTAYGVGVEVLDNGATVQGGVRVGDTGLVVKGTTRISAGGSIIRDGLLVPDVGLAVVRGGMSTGGPTSSGQVRVEKDGIRVSTGGLTLRDTGIILVDGANITGNATIENGVLVNDTGLTIATDSLTLHGGWESRMLINHQRKALTMLDIRSRSEVTHRQFMASHDSTDDLVIHGTYNGSTVNTFDIEIDHASATGDTFKWRKCEYTPGAKRCTAEYTTGVPVSTFPTYLIEGVKVAFASITGHQKRDRWRVDVKPTNPLGSAAGTYPLSTPFQVGQDGSILMSAGTTVRGGMVLSASSIPVGNASISRKGLVTSGQAVVASGGMHVMQDSLDVLGGLIIAKGNSTVAGNIRINSSHGDHTAAKAVIATGQLTTDQVIIARGGLRILDYGMNVTGGALTVSDGDVNISSGIVVSSDGIVIKSGGLLLKNSSTQNLHIGAGGSNISGGVHIQEGGVQVLLGGMYIMSIAGGTEAAVKVSGGLNLGTGMTVTHGGVTVHGLSTRALTTTKGTVKIKNGLSVNNSSDTGLLVKENGARLSSGRLSIRAAGAHLRGKVAVNGSLIIKAGPLLVSADGASVANGARIDNGAAVFGGVKVTGALALGMAGGVRVSSDGGSVVSIDDGLQVRDGMTVASAGMLLSDTGMQLHRGDWIVHGGVTMGTADQAIFHHMAVDSVSHQDLSMSLRNSVGAPSMTIRGTSDGLTKTYVRSAAKFGGKFSVYTGGVSLGGGFRISEGIADVSGKVLVSGGMVARLPIVADGGVSVHSGIISVFDGASVAGGLYLQAGGLRIVDALHTDRQLNIVNGGLTVQDDVSVRGGVNVSGGVTSRQQTFIDDGFHIKGGINISNDRCQFSSDNHCDAGTLCPTGTDFIDCGSNLRNTALHVTDNVTVLSSHRVGINTAAPSYMLDIKARSEITQPTFAGVKAGGVYTGHTSSHFMLEVDSVLASGDTFKWMKDGVTMESRVAIIAGVPLDLMEGVTATFTTSVGHKLGDQWLFAVRSINAIAASGMNGSSFFAVGQNGVVQASGKAQIEKQIVLPTGDLRLRERSGIQAVTDLKVRTDLRLSGSILYNGTGLSVSRGLILAAGNVLIGSAGANIAGGLTTSSTVTINQGNISVQQGNLSIASRFNIQGRMNTGSMTVTCKGAAILRDGLTVAADGVSIVDGGLSIVTKGIDVGAGGVSVVGGTRVKAGGADITAGGLRIKVGGASTVGGVTVSDGVTVLNGGAVVSVDGAKMSGGVIVNTGGVTIEDGMRVQSHGAEVSGGMIIDAGVHISQGGVRVGKGGVRVNSAALDRVLSVNARSSVQHQAESHNADDSVVAFGGVYTGFHDALYEVKIVIGGRQPQHSWRKCAKDGYTTSLSVSTPVCSLFSPPAHTVNGKPFEMSEGVWFTFSGVDYVVGDVWVTHVVAVDAMAIRAPTGTIVHTFGQDGSSHFAKGSTFRGGMRVDDGILVSTGRLQASGGARAAATMVSSGGLSSLAGGLVVRRNGVHLHGAIEIEGNMDIRGTLKVADDVVLHKNTLVSGATTVSGGLRVQGGAEIDYGVTVADTGLAVHASSSSPVRVVGGHLSINSASSSHMVALKSSIDQGNMLRVQTWEGSRGMDVNRNGSVWVSSSATIRTGSVIVHGTTNVLQGGVRTVGSSRVAGTVRVSDSMNVMSDGVRVAGRYTAQSGMRVSGKLDLATSSLEIQGGTIIVGGVQLGPSSSGLHVEGGAKVKGGVVAKGQALTRTYGVRIADGLTSINGTVISKGGLLVDSLAVQDGAISVSAGGLMISGGLTVRTGSFSARQGLRVTSAGALLSGGLRLLTTGAIITSGNVVLGDAIAVNIQAPVNSSTVLNANMARFQGSSFIDSVPTDQLGRPSSSVFTSSGSYLGSIACGIIRITIDGVSVTGDTFSWRQCTQRDCRSTALECGSSHASNPILASKATKVIDGITITFSAATGHVLNAEYAIKFGSTNALKLSGSGGADAFIVHQDGAMFGNSGARVSRLHAVDVGLSLVRGNIILQSGSVASHGGLKSQSSLLVAKGVSVAGGEANVADGVVVTNGGLDARACHLNVTGGATVEKGMKVLDGVAVHGGADVSGGLILDKVIAPNGVTSLAGGVFAIGGGNVTGGANVTKGILNITGGGLRVSGGFVTAEGIAVNNTGLRITNGGFVVARHGMKAAGGTTVRNDGIAVTGGLRAKGGMRINGAVRVSGGSIVTDGGAAILRDGLTVAADGVSIVDGGLSIVTKGIDVG
eukprot:COSAG01_NODE_1783_length_9239_cov_12.422101_1_plen_2917_part_10